MQPITDAVANFAGFSIITLLFLIASGILIASNRTVARKARNAFLGVVVSLFIIASADWINDYFNGTHPELQLFHTLSMAFTFAIAPVLPIVIANTLFPERYVKWVFGIMGVQILLEVATIFGGFVFSVDATNTYHRGPFYFLYMTSYAISACYLVFESVKARSVYQLVSMPTVLSILFLMMAGVGIQIAFPTVRTSWPSVAMAVLLYFQFYSEMVLRTDALTKLLNRHSYDEFLNRPNLPCTAVLIDVDRFKHVNDTYGHAYGDECLITVASLIRKAFGSSGLCYRTGGDEFTVVVRGDNGDVDAMTARLNKLIARAQEKDPRIPDVSVGSARAGADCTDVEAVIKQADQAMYKAKRQRKSCRL